MDLFTYGTLMVPSIFASVTGRHLPGHEACLPGYARFCIKNEVYPGIIASPGHTTYGMVYLDVDEQSISKLDIFEGDYYLRTLVRVTTEDAKTHDAQTYVLKDQYRYLLSKRKWDVEAFSNDYKNEFRNEYFGFSAICHDKKSPLP